MKGTGIQETQKGPQEGHTSSSSVKDKGEEAFSANHSFSNNARPLSKEVFGKGGGDSGNVSSSSRFPIMAAMLGGAMHLGTGRPESASVLALGTTFVGLPINFLFLGFAILWGSPFERFLFLLRWW